MDVYQVTISKIDTITERRRFDNLDKARQFFMSSVFELGGHADDITERSVSYMQFDNTNDEVILDFAD